jgi:hypothetical protein
VLILVGFRWWWCEKFFGCGGGGVGSVGSEMSPLATFALLYHRFFNLDLVLRKLSKSE